MTHEATPRTVFRDVALHRLASRSLWHEQNAASLQVWRDHVEAIDRYLALSA
jgi:hypothetical protein